MRRFWAGAAAGCAFLVVELAARLLLGIPTLAELIQDRLIQFLPGSVFAFVLDRLLYLGKPLLFAGLLLAQLVVAGLGGIASRPGLRPIALAAIGWLATGLILLPLVGQGLFAGRLDVLGATLLAFAVYGGALAFYLAEPGLGVNGKATTVPAESTTPVTPRRLLVGGGLTFVLSAILGRSVVGTLPALPPRPGEAAADTNRVDTGPASAAADLPAAVTPPDQFYVVSKNLVDPVVDVASWTLTIDGQVTHPLTLSYADVLALPAVETYRTLECISNEVGGDLISNGQWTGTPLGNLLQKAGLSPRADLVHFTSVDGYTENMPLDKALDPSTLLVYKLDGQPLTPKHGFPLRVLGTGTYGMKNPKWLTRIQVALSAPPGFWETQGWNADAIVQTMSRIDTPRNGARVRLGTIGVAGVAFAGARGISKVEVSTDGGSTWAAAELQPPLGPSTWILWKYRWKPAQPGQFTLVVRATDGTGQLQKKELTDTFPNGATGYHQITVQVVS